MRHALFSKKRLLLILVTQFSIASSQVPPNYVPLDQVGRPESNANRVRASTYREGDESLPRKSIRASTNQDNLTIGLSDAEEDVDQQSQTNISNQPLGNVTATANGIAFPMDAVVALGSDPVQAYTAKNYPSIARGTVQRVKDTQAQYAESLASQDIINMLGRPFLKMEQGSGVCVGNQSGQLFNYYYLIRDGSTPKQTAVVKFCADSMQSIAIQSLN